MLGNKEFQTPNAIDPGDDLPSRPSRRGSAVADVPSVEDVRMNAARLLQDTEEIPIDGPNDFPYDADDNRDEEFGEDDRYSSSLPSVEEARMYAGRILSGARSSRDLSPGATERARLTNANFKGFSKHGIPLSDFNGARRKRRFKCCLGALLFIILGAIILGLSTSGSKSRGDLYNFHSSHPQLSERMKKAVEFLKSKGYSTAESLQNHESPQFKAANWISDYDIVDYDIPYQNESKYDVSDFVERYILAVFFYATGGGDGEWKETHKFLSEENHCAWFTELELADADPVALGVSCDASSRVSEILLPKNGLIGSLPPELAHLEELHFLDIKDNDVAGKIPDEFERLSKLDFFDVRRNSMTGKIPEWIGDTWTKLEELGLAENQFTGSLPASMAALRSLKTLSLSDNNLSGSVGMLWGITQMEFLYLEGNAFTGELDSMFCRDMESLIQLDISSNVFVGTNLPVHLLQHTTLEVLDISDNDLVGTIPEITEQNEKLKFLAAADTLLTGSLPKSISNLSGLHHLDLTDNDLTGDIPESLSNIAKLSYLFLSGNPDFQSGPVPAFVQSMTELRELSLSDTGRVGGIPFWIGNMKQLVLLDLSHNDLIGEIPASIWQLPNLSYLLLQGNKLSGQFPAGATQASKLELLLLEKNDISGALTEVCNMQVKHVYADCDKIECNCCQCCKDKEVNCNDLNLLYSNKDFHWEYNYERVSYAFSPEILISPATDKN